MAARKIFPGSFFHFFKIARVEQMCYTTMKLGFFAKKSPAKKSPAKKQEEGGSS